MERTLVILKPDAVRRKLIGEIINRIERKGYTISHMKMSRIPREAAEVHYAHVKALPIYEAMLDYFTSGDVVLLVVEGEQVIQTVRNLVGKTSTFDSPAGTIRGDFGSHRYENLIHASDSVESAEIEIIRFFSI